MNMLSAIENGAFRGTILALILRHLLSDHAINAVKLSILSYVVPPNLNELEDRFVVITCL